jgi:RepB DNA-primase from phage plasmid
MEIYISGGNFMTNTSNNQQAQDSNYQQTLALLGHLFRGGKYSYFWTDEPKQSYWFDTNEPVTIPDLNANIYFGVNPTAGIPTRLGADGQPIPPQFMRSENIEITAVNDLYSDIDAKDFGSSKEEAWEHVEQLDPPPSVVIDSGGGYHCYWLFRDTFFVRNSEDRQRAQCLQQKWVAFTQGDNHAKDLCRILRVPGTRNMKYEPDYPTVKFVCGNFDCLYDFAKLEKLVPSCEPEDGHKEPPYVEAALRYEELEKLTAADHDKGSNAYAEAALRKEGERVRTAEEGARNDTLNKASFALGQLVGAGRLDYKRVERELVAASKSLVLDDGRQSVLATIGSGLKDGMKEPRKIPEPVSTEDKVEGKDTKPTKKDSSPATLLLKLIDRMELFHTSGGDAYATVPVKGHMETYRVGSKGMSKELCRWLTNQYYEAHHSVPGASFVQDSKTTIDWRAINDGPETTLHIRVAGVDGKVYIDLCNAKWQVVEITPEGWKVLDQSPVKFMRRGGMLALPLPQRGGSINELHPFLNLASENDWLLICGWLIGALQPKQPYPILALHGEQGSAKSTATKALRKLIDPGKPEFRGAPRGERDFWIAANNARVVAYDNISGIQDWLSDCLCTLSTGGGYGTRMMYSDDDETLFDVSRPVIINGINELANREDLLDRTIMVELQPISDSMRRTESEFWGAYDNVRPRILGALYDAVSAALRELPNTILEKPPRMADFAHWVTASESSWGEPGAFLEAYTCNRNEGNQMAIDASIVAVTLQKYMTSKASWSGTATELDNQLKGQLGPEIPETWPKNARGLSAALRRVIPPLRSTGLDVHIEKKLITMKNAKQTQN